MLLCGLNARFQRSFVDKLKTKCGATESGSPTDCDEVPTYSFAGRERFSICVILV